MTSAAPQLSIYGKSQLGDERARLAEGLRQRLWDAGVKWPQWIDARPGRLSAIIGDGSDPPLGRTNDYLLREQRELVVEGLGALGLALLAPRLVLVTPSVSLVQSLRQRLGDTNIEIQRAPALFPAQAARAVKDLVAAPWTVSTQFLARAGAVLRKTAIPQLVSVVGALRSPGVFSVAAGETPRQLVRRAGGAQKPAWVALTDDPLNGTLWPADKPLDGGTSLLYILPASHPLIKRHKGALRERVSATCLTCRQCTDFCLEAPQGTAPHLVMQALSRRGLDGKSAAAAAGCTSCGACSVSCPAELLPSALVSALAQALPPRESDEPPPPSAKSRLPLELTLRRLDLLRYAEP